MKQLHWGSGIMAMIFSILPALCMFGTTGALAQEPGGTATGRDAGTARVNEGGTEFRFAYYPSYDTIRFCIVSAPKGVSAWDISLKKSPDGKVLASKAGHLPFLKSGEMLATPKLTSSDYLLTLVLSGDNGARYEIQRTFTRQAFPWEKTALGRSDIVIPPFTPMKVNTRQGTVDCVLRRHQMSDIGLWTQVTSEDHALLTGPLRLEVQAGGQRYTASGKPVSFSTKKATRVAGHTSWQAGPLHGSTSFDYDYDGMMKVTLQLQPAQEQVESIDLVIPLKSEEAWLMHPVTDYLRMHYAGRIPAQWSGEQNATPQSQGKVWDSANIPRSQLPAPFVPYIWVGGPERGICWFAENTKDWLLDAKAPTLEIRRQGDTVALVVHFVTRPAVITRERTIVFGLQATPAKPMPETPYNFRRWWEVATKSTTSDIAQFKLIGSCYYWGAAGPCLAFYPAFKNFSIYDALGKARRTGIPDRSFLEKWLSQFNGPEFTDEERATYRASLSWMVGQLAYWRSTPDKVSYVIPYTNGRSINWDDEVKTYLDEWSTIDIADPRWPGEERFQREPNGNFVVSNWSSKNKVPGETAGVAYGNDPASSWVDMVLYYEKKMFESFADGIYWDDFFFVANYNPVAGPGYIDDDGTLRPGVNIFGFRELVKRTAVMQYQMGMRPLSFIHMTNVNAVPILSFGTILLDHEWRDTGANATKDFQDRLDLNGDTSMLLAQSTGFQSGNIGVVIDRFHEGDRQHLLRTAMAVALPHEMKFQMVWEEQAKKVIDLLSNFGYGKPDCKVYRYWEEPQPVTATGADVKLLTLNRNNRALIIAGNMGEAGDVTLNLDLKVLHVPEDAIAVNMETGAPITKLGPGKFQFPIEKHDFRLVLVEWVPGSPG